MFFASVVIHPPLIIPSSTSPLSPSFFSPPQNDLHCYNYWVISTVITLNICSVTMLRAFACALWQLFYVLTVLWCRQTNPPPFSHCSQYVLSALERWTGFYVSGGSMLGWFACAGMWESEEESDWRGRLSCRRALLRSLEVKGQLMILSQKSNISWGETFQYQTLQRRQSNWYYWQNYHPPSWFPLMDTPILSCVSVCLSLWMNNKQPPSRQTVKQANL